MTYAEFLRSQGASDAEIAILDTPVGRRAYDAQQALVDAAAAERDRANQVATETNDWFNNVQTPEWNRMNNELIAAKSNAARFQTALRTAEERGLLNVSKDLGLDMTTPAGTPITTTPAGTPGAIDPRYMTVEQATQIAADITNSIAIAQDIVAEHSQLFPGQRLNFTALREEAIKARQRVLPYWESKYKVAEARAKQAADIQAAHDKKVADDAVKAAREQWARDYSVNPDLRTPVASTASITVRKNQQGEITQPWQRSEGQLSDDRVQRALEKQRLRDSGQRVM